MSFEEVLEKVTQFGWLEAPIIFSPSLLNELGIECKVDYRGSWIRIMLNFLLSFNSVSVRNLFFWTFCENILRFFTIMLVCCSQLNELTCSYFHRAFDTFLNATLCWSDASRMGKCWNWLDDVVATTRRNGTCSLLTSAKLLTGYLVVGITRELNKESLLYWSSIYTTSSWSVLQQ